MKVAGDQRFVVQEISLKNLLNQIVTAAYLKERVKNVFLKISQILQENTCVGVFFK